MDPKEIIKALPSYLNFAIRLLRWPPDALKPYCGTGEVASALVGSLLTGIGVSYVIVLAIGPASIVDDPSWLVQRIKRDRELASRCGCGCRLNTDDHLPHSHQSASLVPGCDSGASAIGNGRAPWGQDGRFCERGTCLRVRIYSRSMCRRSIRELIG